MRIRTYLGSAVGGAAALALLAGCSGGSSMAPASPGSGLGAPVQSVGSSVRHALRVPSVLPPGALALHRSAVPVKGFVDVNAVMSGGDQVIVSDFSNSAVYVFGGGGKINATLTSVSSPQGLTTDSKGTLYVANTGASDILVFPKPYTAATVTLSDPNYFPTDVALDSSGNVGVTNILATSGGAGNVQIYAKGSTTACATVSDPNWFEVYFGAFDKAGNFYIDGRDANGATLVGEVTGGCSATAITTLTTSNVIGFPGGVQVLKNGNIAIDDQTFGAPVIDTYAPPSGGSFGSPVATTTLTGAMDPVTFAIKAGDANLWTADAGNFNANKYAYPAGGAAIRTFTTSFGQPIGVAVNPAQTL